MIVLAWYNKADRTEAFAKQGIFGDVDTIENTLRRLFSSQRHRPDPEACDLPAADLHAALPAPRQALFQAASLWPGAAGLSQVPQKLFSRAVREPIADNYHERLTAAICKTREICLNPHMAYQRFMGASLGMLLLISGCAVTRGYTGPELPTEKISNIAIHGSGNISIGTASIDSTELGAFSSSIDLAEGRHQATVSYGTEFESCFSSDICEIEVIQGKCDGSITTLPGRRYLITIEERSGIVQGRVSAKSYFDFSEREDEAGPGYLACETTSSYTRFRRKER